MPSLAGMRRLTRQSGRSARRFNREFHNSLLKCVWNRVDGRVSRYSSWKQVRCRPGNQCSESSHCRGGKPENVAIRRGRLHHESSHWRLSRRVGTIAQIADCRRGCSKWLQEWTGDKDAPMRLGPSRHRGVKKKGPRPESIARNQRAKVGVSPMCRMQEGLTGGTHGAPGSSETTVMAGPSTTMLYRPFERYLTS
jgi:hypothetical protein